MWSYYLVEFSAFILFGAVLVTAYRRGARDVLVAVAGALYGLAIELMFVHFAGGYEYGQFALMVAGAPVWVAAGWGVILFTAVQAAEVWPIRDWGKPAVAALAAVSLDFALDPLAEALGWWHWKRPDPGFFEVSYDNFTGWLLIVGSYAAALRFLPRWWGPLAALPISVAVVAACTPVLEAVYPALGEGPVFLAIHTVFVLVALLAGWRETPWYQLAVPAYFHALFTFLLLAASIDHGTPELLGVFAISSSLSLLLFRQMDPSTVSLPK